MTVMAMGWETFLARRNNWRIARTWGSHVSGCYRILFTIPGSPVLYYGDEIGMGDNITLHDRNGLRTPMQWSSDQNAGFSQAEPE
jgi:glycosidase